MREIEFWGSADAQNFPFSITEHNEDIKLRINKGYYRNLWLELQRMKVIPEDGEILELGAGQSSQLLFPKKIVRSRLTATDMNPWLLEKNATPVERKLLLRAGREKLPMEWTNRFSLVIAIQLHRYLEQSEKTQLALEALDALQPGGHLVIVDFPNNMSADIARIVDEKAHFSPRGEKTILEQAGFTWCEWEGFEVPYYSGRYEHINHMYCVQGQKSRLSI